MASRVVFAMIKDPVNMKRKTERLVVEHFKRTSEPFFYITDNLVGLLKAINVPLWSIAHHDDDENKRYYSPGYYVGMSKGRSNDNRRTRDEMMELLETEYQEYLEWFIWNPGWL